MSLTDDDYRVGHCRPPRHSRFQPGQSGNPSGRPKGAPNLKTLLEKVLKETIALREGTETKKLTKAEAVIRSVVIGALKGDSRSQATLFKLAEQVGQFGSETNNEPLTIKWITTYEADERARSKLPAINQINRE